MLKHVLIPLDGSELAEQSLSHLMRFVSPTHVTFSLLAALSAALPGVNDVSQPSMDEALITANEQIRAHVQAVRERLEQAGFRATEHCMVGDPADCILHMAEEEHVDLIAMSTHGRTGFRRALLGSVSDKVIRHARPPVFLVPTTAAVKAEKLPEMLLVPLDGTAFAETALPLAQSFAQALGASVQLVRVIEPANAHEREMIFGTADNFSTTLQTQMAQAATYLEQIRLRFQLAGISATPQIVVGKPATAILETANSQQVDLIVMSTHGRSGVNRLLYGSVASEVIHESACPLLLLHGQEAVQVEQPTGNVAPATSLLGSS